MKYVFRRANIRLPPALDGTEPRRDSEKLSIQRASPCDHRRGGDLAMILAPVLANASGHVSRTTKIKGTVKVSNFPATQPVSGTVNIGDLPVTQNVGGTVKVGNLPAVQNVTGTVSVGSGTVTANPGLPGAPYGITTAGDGDSTNTAIPTGETLVVQTVSVQVEVLSGYAAGADLEWTTDSNTSDLFVPLTYQYSIGGDDVYDGTTRFSCTPTPVRSST